MSSSSWFEERGMADAVLEVVFDGDRRGTFPPWFQPHGLWFSVPVLPTDPLPGLPQPYAYDFRVILDDLVPVPGVTYLLDAFALSPELTHRALPAGATFSLFPGRVAGHGTLVEWLTI
jgi:hypothetical protein